MINEDQVEQLAIEWFKELGVRLPPDQQMEAIKMVMRQEEVLSDEWSQEDYISIAKPCPVNNAYDPELMAAEPKPKYGEKEDR